MLSNFFFFFFDFFKFFKFKFFSSGLFCFILFKNTLRALIMLTASQLAPFLGQFQKIKKKKFVWTFSLFFSFFKISFLIFWFEIKWNKGLLRGIKGAMIVSFLKQVLKLFWDNCKWTVLSHLLEKCCTFLHFLSNCLDGVRFFFIFNCLLQIDFRILESNDNINTFLTSYLKLQLLYSFVFYGKIRILDWRHLV